MVDTPISETPIEPQAPSEISQPLVVQSSPVIVDPDIAKNQEVAGLSYMPLVCVFIYFFRKDSAFIQKNAKQGVSLFLLIIIGWILTAIPFIKVFGFLILVFSLVFIILGFIKATSEGVVVNIPVLSNYLRNMDIDGMKKDVQQVVDTTMNTPVVNEERMEKEGVQEALPPETKQ